MVAEPRARAPRRAPPRVPGGVVAVEFALLLALFVGVVYVLAETAHAMYLAVTVQDMTRRAARAAAASFTDTAALRQGALLAGANGKLLLGGGIDASYLRIDYLSLDASEAMQPVATAALPACPALNRAVCAANPRGGACVRFVRARLCQPDNVPGNDGDCAAVAYPTLLPLPAALRDYVPQALSLGAATTVVPAETLGYRPNQSCP